MNMDILKEKVKADKGLVVVTNMNLGDAEAKNFWPLCESYQRELEQLNQRMVSNIKAYVEADNAGKGEISNETAKKLLSEALAQQESEVKLWQSYVGKPGKVLPAMKVARSLQIKSKIRDLENFELAAQILLVN